MSALNERPVTRSIKGPAMGKTLNGVEPSQRAEFLVDDEIAVLIPSLSPEELAQLERSILAEGCREPLLVWDDGRRKILVDGHNRYTICRRHGVPYIVRTIQLADRDAAIRWVAEHQLGRRNLVPEAYAYLRGKLYNGTKSQGARRDLTSGHNARKSTTAQEIAAQYKVDEKTIRRDGHFAEQLDQLAELVGADVKNMVLARGARISRTDVGHLVGLQAPVQKRILADVKHGAKASVLLRKALGVVETGTDKKAKTPVATSNGAKPPDLNVESATSHGVGASPGASDGGVEAALEHLRLADVALRQAAGGSISTELIARMTERVQAINAVLEAHRRVAPPRSGLGVRRAEAAEQASKKRTRNGDVRSLIASISVDQPGVVRGDAIDPRQPAIVDGVARSGVPDLLLGLEPRLVLLHATLQRSPATLLGKAELCAMVSRLIDFLHGRNDGSFLLQEPFARTADAGAIVKSIDGEVLAEHACTKSSATSALDIVSPGICKPIERRADHRGAVVAEGDKFCSDAALPKATRQVPTSDEIAAVISQIIEDYKNGHLRLPFAGQHAIVRKYWPRSETAAALTMFFKMLEDLRASERAATAARSSARVPDTVPVEAESPSPDIGAATSQASASARAAASALRDHSRPGTGDMARAVALAWTAAPLPLGLRSVPLQAGILTAAARLAGIGC